METSRPKVLWLPKWYPNKFDKLDGVFTVDHAKATVKHADIYVLYVHSDTELKEKRKEIYSEENGFPELKVYFRYRKTGIGPLDKLLIGLKYVSTQFKAYRKIKREWGYPDLVHVHVLLRASFLAAWLRSIKGIPYMITEHWSGYDTSSAYHISAFKRIFLKRFIKRAYVTTAVSKYLMEHIKNLCPKANYEIVSNAVDESRFVILPKPQRQKKKIVHVSTLDDYPKNFGNILRSIADVSNQNQDFELHVIGKGVEREKQEALATELGIKDSFVFFRGELTKEDVAREVAESDFMILFSHYETQSCVVLESLMSGVPVIVPRLGGVQELVSEQNGVAVTPGDNTEFANAILSFLSDEKSFDQEKIRIQALQYGYNQVGEKFADLYREVLKSR